MQKFWSKVSVDVGGCWLWRASKFTNGYGQFGTGSSSRGTRKNNLAHKFAYELVRGSRVPDGMYVCHTCDNPSCVRPAHLFVATPAENTADMMRKGRKPPNRQRRLSDAEVRAIRAAPLGWGRAVARGFGACRQTASWIRSRRIYRDVD